LTPANQASTKSTFQPIQVGLVQNNIAYPGSGVYHYLGDDGPGSPPLVLLAFYVRGPQGDLMFFQGSVAPRDGYAGGGTYYPAAAPQWVTPWSISTNAAPSSRTPAPNDLLSHVLPLLNQVRLHSGLAPLNRSSALDAAAMDQARDMAAHNFLGNQASDGSSIDQRMRRHGYQPRTWGQWVAAGVFTASDLVNQGTGDRRIEHLIVTAGCGWAQRWGGPIEEIRPGDVVWFAPGEKHWHGATPTTAMTHIAIQEKRDGKVVDWMEKVSDEQYHI